MATGDAAEDCGGILDPGSSARNGETSATKLGRDTHRAWDYGQGFEKEFTLPIGKRVDGINFESREVVELKPDNPPCGSPWRTSGCGLRR